MRRIQEKGTIQLSGDAGVRIVMGNFVSLESKFRGLCKSHGLLKHLNTEYKEC